MEDQTQVNIPLLRKAVEWAEAEAQRSDSAWDQWSVAEVKETSHCGTAFCVAGWTLFESGWTPEEIREDENALDAAAALLGIPSWTDAYSLNAEHLFDGNNKIADVRRIAEDIAGERL